MNVLLLSVGIPGSGKTTLLKEIAKERGWLYICPDNIREELTGDVSNQLQDGDVWALARCSLTHALGCGMSVVFDATFVYSSWRKNVIGFARRCGAERVLGIYFDIPLYVAMERNAARERQVADEVLVRMNNSLKRYPPAQEEGFDRLVTFVEYQNSPDFFS